MTCLIISFVLWCFEFVSGSDSIKKRSDQWLFLRCILCCKYLWCLCHATNSHMVLRPSISILLRLKLWKFNKLCHIIIKDKGKPDVMTRSVLSMTRSLYHILHYCHILSSKGQSCQRRSRLLHSHIIQSTILMPHVLIMLGTRGILLRIVGFSKLECKSLLIRRFCHSLRWDTMS